MTVLKSDRFVVSYPKSGNTWMRFLLANIISQNKKITFKNIEEIIPDIYKNTDKQLLNCPQPRILKSHESFTPSYEKIVYIVRDPRAVAVSYYHFVLKTRKIDAQMDISKFVALYLDGYFGKFGNWRDNVLSWLKVRTESERLLLVRYEDMHEDTVQELRRVVTFFNLNAGMEECRTAVEASKAEKMRAMEKNQSDKWATTQNTRNDINFVRSAQAFAWKKELPEEDAHKIFQRWKKTMLALGYNED